MDVRIVHNSKLNTPPKLRWHIRGKLSSLFVTAIRKITVISFLKYLYWSTIYYQRR